VLDPALERVVHRGERGDEREAARSVSTCDTSSGPESISMDVVSSVGIRTIS
jgi:hypothetical protein